MESTNNFYRMLITWFQNQTGFSVDSVVATEEGYEFTFQGEFGSNRIVITSSKVFDSVFTTPEVVENINEQYADSLAKLHGYMSPEDFAETFTNIVGLDISDDEFDRYITWYESGKHGLNDYEFLSVLRDVVDLNAQINLFLEDIGG